jgi:type I restriction-modification system DNA methylase subunit
MNKLVNNIWSFTNEVRGHKSISELKEIVVSLIFLKHATDEYLSNPFSNISVPEKSQYPFLAENLNNSDLMNYLWDAFDAIETENVQLRDTLTNFNFSNRFNNKDDFYLIQNLIIKICEFGLLKGDVSFSNFIGELLSKFADYEGKKGGDFTTPDSVSQLMVQLLNPVKGIVLDSTCGIGGFFQEVEDNYPNNKFKFYGQEYNGATLALAKLRFAFIEKNAIQFGERESTLRHDQFPELKADYVIMHPPFNLRTSADEIVESDSRFEFGLPPKSNANMAWIQHALYHLNEDGKSAVLLSNGSLFSSGKETEIRKNLIEADLVESIITLPSGMLSNTSISCCIWVLNKNKTKKHETLFIDATNFGHKEKGSSQKILDDKSINQITSIFRKIQNNTMFYAGHTGLFQMVEHKEIIENDYLLTPSRYVGLEHEIKEDLSKAVPLGTVIEYVKPKKLDGNVTYKKVSIKDLSSVSTNYLLDTDNLTEGELKSNYKVLPNNVLLIPRLGDKLKFSYCTQSDMNIAFSANSIFTFRVDIDKISLDYLIGELFKPYLHFQYSAFKFGAGIKLIRLKDLLNIKILIPSLKEQKRVIEEGRERQFQSAAKDLGFEKEIAKLKEAQIKDLGSKKHNIMQHLNNVKASADVLTSMMELNNGVLKSDEIIDPRRGVTVEKRFLRLQESLEKVIYYVNNITNEISYDATEVLNPIKLLKEFKERGVQNDNFSIEIIIDKATFDGREPLISISKNDFEEIYNNILENAINHGFIHEDKSYTFRISMGYIDDVVEIFFENNGKPFPKGISDQYYVKGEKAGTTAGTGIGLWKVAEIAKHFNCKMEVIDEPTNDFPVGFKFKFNLETL